MMERVEIRGFENLIQEPVEAVGNPVQRSFGCNQREEGLMTVSQIFMNVLQVVDQLEKYAISEREFRLLLSKPPFGQIRVSKN
jgi:hypothetical protein